MSFDSSVIYERRVGRIYVHVILWIRNLVWIKKKCKKNWTSVNRHGKGAKKTKKKGHACHSFNSYTHRGIICVVPIFFPKKNTKYIYILYLYGNTCKMRVYGESPVHPQSATAAHIGRGDDGFAAVCRFPTLF